MSALGFDHARRGDALQPARDAERDGGSSSASAGQELMTVLARRAAAHGDPVVRRQPEGEPVRVPGTGVTVTPGPPTGLLGSRLQIPSSLRISSIGGLGREPSFLLDLSPDELIGVLLGSIDLHSSTRPGTPPDDVSDASRQRIRLVNPVLRLEPSAGRLSGAATLSIDSEYPAAFKGPTEVDVRISSSSLGRFSGRLDYGPLHSDFQLSLRYDTGRLARSLSEGLSELGAEATHPGFRLSGGVRLGPLPISSFSADAPTTRPLDRPLPGAPAPFPVTVRAGGVIVAPAGSLVQTAAPALGYTYASYGARSGTSFTAAALPTLSPASISAGRGLAESFPVYGFVEFTHVRRVSEGLDLGLRVTAQIDTGTLFGSPQPPSADPRGQPPAADQPPQPLLGASVFGRFGGP
jgi:hypothetical protein